MWITGMPNMDMMNAFLRTHPYNTFAGENILLSFQKHTGTYSYQYWNVESFLEMYVSSQDRYHHEMIHSNFLCTGYMDLDFKKNQAVQMTREEWDAMIQQVIALFIDYYPGTVPPIIWTRDTEQKFSTHLHFYNLWFNQPSSCMRFIQHEVIPKCPALSPPNCECIVDYRVYPISQIGGDGVRKTLRLPLSMKRDEPLTSRFQLMTTGMELKEAVRLSIIQHRNPLGAEIHSYGEDELVATNTAYAYSNSSLTKEQEKNIEAWLVDWIGVTWKKKLPTSAGGWHCMSVYCPLKGDRHGTQSTYLHVDSKRARFTCQDCLVTYDAGVDMRYVMDKEKRVGLIQDELVQKYLSCCTDV